VARFGFGLLLPCIYAGCRIFFDSFSDAARFCFGLELVRSLLQWVTRRGITSDGGAPPPPRRRRTSSACTSHPTRQWCYRRFPWTRRLRPWTRRLRLTGRLLPQPSIHLQPGCQARLRLRFGMPGTRRLRLQPVSSRASSHQQRVRQPHSLAKFLGRCSLLEICLAATQAALFDRQ